MKTAKLPSSLRPIKLTDNIRLGNRNDGGYIISKQALDDSSVLLSFGINLDWTFEKAIRKFFPTMRIEMYDKTSSLQYAAYWGISRFLYSPFSWKKSHFMAILKPLDHYLFFQKGNLSLNLLFVGIDNNSTHIAVGDILTENMHRGKIFLKIDIEGMEYSILEELLNHQERISGMVIEFHSVNSDARFSSILNKVGQFFWISHIHVNNFSKIDKTGLPDFLEISFVNKHYCESPEFHVADTYRHHLDTPNLPDIEDIIIAFGSE